MQETQNPPPPLKSVLTQARQRGFALVVTLSLMILLTVIAVGLLSLASISLRSSSQGSALATARANARMALMLAIGELQKQAGPDQRVSGNASLVEAPQNPNWTGIWRTDQKGSQPNWLVSGDKPDPFAPLDDKTSALLLTASKDNADSKELRVPLTKVTGKNAVGNFGWWVGDEGVKARVDLQAPKPVSSPAIVRFSRSRIAPENGIGKAGDDLAVLESRPDLDKRQIVTASTLALAAANLEVPKKYYHDLTTGGATLPVNVVTGGMKTDLSLIFDSSQSSSGLTEEFLGASFKAKTVADAKIQEPSVKNPAKFYFASEISGGGSNPAGPNWGVLYNYAKIWSSVSNQAVPMTALNPRPECDIRTNDWPPNRNVDKGSYKRDIQHTNTSLTPVIGYLQMGFRMRAKPTAVPYIYNGKECTDGYQMQLDMKPVVGLWNPYNVKINATPYRIDWALYPYLRIGLKDKAGKLLSTPRTWMREQWKSGAGSGSTPETSQDRWFQLRTPSIDLQPGEFRLFSVTTNAELADVNDLVSGWNEEGGFVFDLVSSRFDAAAKAGAKIIVPPGSVAWYGDLFLEDLQHEDTPKQFPGGFLDGTSASWITLKANTDNVIHRISDLWLTPRPGQKVGSKDWRIPEQVISVSDATGGKQTSPQVRVEQLAKSPWHIGTWAWNTRTTTEAIDQQSTRGWSDTNVRYAAANPLWDGSKLGSSGKYDGWYFNTPMLGGSWGDPSKPYSKSAVNGDKGPGGRGKVAEGQLGDQEPEASIGGRYQGFGGASTASGLGQNHVVLFDVPRSPLVSIGQFQHAQVSRYSFDPSFAIGASYANPRIPLGSIYSDNFAGVSQFRMTDLSYILNRELWDNYMFSTIGNDYMAGSGSLDKSFPWKDLSTGKMILANPRYRFVPQGGDTSLDKIIKDSGRSAPVKLASRIMIDGGFNVNSTSKAAWKAVLSSMAGFELPVIGLTGTSASWETPAGVRFPRFGHVASKNGWSRDTSGSDPSFWRGYRTLDSKELDQLAQAIVEEVRERGPFRSFAEFVNRNPESSRPADLLKGPLQAAIDRTVNASLPSEVGKSATQPSGAGFSAAITGENQSSGFPGYLSQGDILQCLAPVLGVRSDYFRIVTMGEATDATGKVIARARCEAFVQRLPEFVDSADSPGSLPAEISRSVNRAFGRRFQLVSFRWLDDKNI
jgi:type II secretory pathway pseudopilin PulG